MTLLLSRDINRGMEPFAKHSTHARKSLLASQLRDVPFQLLPNVVHPPEALERALVWQEQFAKPLTTLPFVRVVTSLSGESLEALLESLALQSYTNFDVTVIGESSALKSRFPELQIIFSADQEKTFSLLGKNQSLLVFITSGGILHPSALLCIAKSAQKSGAGLLYTNEVVLSQDFTRAIEYRRRSSFSKFEPLTSNPFGHCVAIRSEILERLLQTDTEFVFGEFSWIAAFSGAEAHLIPLGLFMRRKGPVASISAHLTKRLEEYAGSIGIQITQSEPFEHDAEIYISLALRSSAKPTAVIIPFHNHSDMTLRALDRLASQRSANFLEIVLVDNRSALPEVETVRSFSRQSSFRNFSIVHDPGYFNYARLNNFGVRHAMPDNEFYLFVNNDVELSDADTLDELFAWAAAPEIGVVGGELRFADGSVQHAGINFLSVRPANVRSAEYSSYRAREVNAVSFALALVKKELFERLHGLNEVDCPNGFGDALFCHEARKLGFRTFYTPRARALHRESISRGHLPEELELYEMASHGLPISDLWGDFSAELQPTTLTLEHPRMVVMKEDEMPLAGLVARILGSPRALRLANSLSALVLKTGRTLKRGKKTQRG